MIRADPRAQPSSLDGEVGGEEAVVDPDPVRRPGRPARLTTEPQPAVSELRGREEPTEMRRPVRAIEVADDDRRTSISTDPSRQLGELAAQRNLIGPLEWREEMDQPEISRFPREIDHGMDGRDASRGQRSEEFDRDRRAAEPKGEPSAVIVEGILETIGEFRPDRLERGDPAIRDLNQADHVGLFPSDQADQGIRLSVLDQHVRHQGSEPGGRLRVGRDRVRPPAKRQAPSLPGDEQPQPDRDRPMHPDPSAPGRPGG